MLTTSPESEAVAVGMQMLVKEITSLNSNTDFRNDVQLRAYYEELNRELVRSYMFTAGSPPGRESSVAVLKRLVDSVSTSSDKRFLVLANFGHGKSHFGLAAANYFGADWESPELNAILHNLGHTLSPKESSTYEALKHFREIHRPYLVLLLSGEGPAELRDKFFAALDDTLAKSSKSAGVSTPFWFGEALAVLQSFTQPEIDAANAFLAAHRLDLPILVNELEAKRSDRFQTCVDLVKHVRGVRPDFGGETSLDEALRWVCTEFCGDGKPYSGVLVLFDEFSLFVEQYARRRQGNAPLQELLNGVENNREHVLFVAFAQFQPESIIPQDQSPNAQSLKRELTRLPANNRISLHSSLEDVLHNYFKLDEAMWKRFLEQGGVAEAVARSSSLTYDLFRKRFNRIAWTESDVRERIAKKCFPLHPLTTVLLSSMDLITTTPTRSILQFLKKDTGAVVPRLEEPAILESRPNWVLPISLVDYFGSAVSDAVWAQFRQTDNPGFSDLERRVLKAMLLQVAGQLDPTVLGRKEGYGILISELCGCSPDEARATLVSLEGGRYIRHDSARGIYSFWSGSNAALELSSLLNSERQARAQNRTLSSFLEALTDTGTNKVNDLLVPGRTKLAATHSVGVAWGHADDWAAHEVVLTREQFTAINLGRLSHRYRPTIEQVPPCRGLVVIAIAETQADVNWFKESTEGILDSDAYLREAPLLVLVPERPQPLLASRLVDAALLEDPQLKSQAIQQIGQPSFEAEVDRAFDELAHTFDDIRDDSMIVVPIHARKSVLARSATHGSGGKRIERLLKDVFEATYKRSVGTFFTQYRHTANPAKLREAVSHLLPILAENRMALARPGLSGVSHELVKLYLEGDWQLFTKDSQPVVAPKTSPLRHGWGVLDGAFASPGAYEIKPTLMKLLNPDFGYDFNTLALLFAAWYGVNRQQVSLIVGNRNVVVNEELIRPKVGGPALKPQAFIAKLSSAKLFRRDIAKRADQVDTYISRVESGVVHTRADAERVVSALDTFVQENSTIDPARSENAASASGKLKSEMEALEVYGKGSARIQEGLERSTAIRDLVQLHGEVARLRAPILITLGTSTPKELVESTLAKLRERTQVSCAKFAQLEKITDFGRNDDELIRIRRDIAKLQLADLEAWVDEARKRLKAARDKLEGARDEKSNLAIINSVTRSASYVGLLEAKVKLAEFGTNASAAVRDAANQRLRKILDEIKALDEFADALPKRLDKVTRAEDARSIQAEILRNQDRFAESKHADGLRFGLQKCDELEAFAWRLEVPVDGSLRVLRQSRLQLAEIASLPPSMMEVARAKAARVEAAVAALEAMPAQWERALELEDKSELVRAVHDDVLARRHLYSDTDLEGVVSALVVRARGVDRFLESLDGFAKRPIADPSDLEAARSEIGQALAESSTLLADAQRGAANAALRKLEETGEKATLRAREWLAEVQHQVEERALSQEDVVALERTLSAPPAFLPDEDERRRADLARVVSEWRSDNAVAEIVLRFRELSDWRKREECLRQLEALVAERAVE